MSDDPSDTKPRAWLGRRARAALVLIAVLVAFAVVVWLRLLWESSVGRKEVAAIAAELDASDPRWRWEEIREDLPSIPDAENSALLVQRVIDSLGTSKPWDRRGADGQPLLSDRPPPNRRLDDSRLAVLRAELSGREESIALAVSLKDLPRGRAAIRLSDGSVSTPLPHVPLVTETARLLEMDVERWLHDGRAAETPARVRGILRAGASLRDDGRVFSAHARLGVRMTAVGRVERLLAMAEPSDEACRELIALLAAEREEDVLPRAVRGERAGYHHLFRNLVSGRLSFDDLMDDPKRRNNPVAWLLGALYPYRLPDDHAFVLRRMTELCDIARLPFEERQAALEAFEAEHGTARQRDRANLRRLAAHLLLPTLRRFSEAATRDRALLSCAIAALAAERHRRAKGRWPESLRDLRPTFLAELPSDPYSGGPLLYAKHAEGVVIYCVGQDGRDDGGRIDPPTPREPPKDVGLRLYDVDRRGLP